MFKEKAVKQLDARKERSREDGVEPTPGRRGSKDHLRAALKSLRSSIKTRSFNTSHVYCWLHFVTSSSCFSQSRERDAIFKRRSQDGRLQGSVRLH